MHSAHAMHSGSASASTSEMQRIVNDAQADTAGNNLDASSKELMWHHEEELVAIIQRTPGFAGSIRSYIRCIIFLAACLSAFSVFMQVRHSGVLCPGHKCKLEKHLV